MFCDEPVKFWPAFELEHLSSGSLGQAFITRLRGQGKGHVTRTLKHDKQVSLLWTTLFKIRRALLNSKASDLTVFLFNWKHVKSHSSPAE